MASTSRVSNDNMTIVNTVYRRMNKSYSSFDKTELKIVNIVIAYHCWSIDIDIAVSKVVLNLHETSEVRTVVQ